MYNDTFNIFQRWTALEVEFEKIKVFIVIPAFRHALFQNTFVLFWSFIYDWKDYEGRSLSQILLPLLPETFLICFGFCHADKQNGIVNTWDHFVWEITDQVSQTSFLWQLCQNKKNDGTGSTFRWSVALRSAYSSHWHTSDDSRIHVDSSSHENSSLAS